MLRCFLQIRKEIEKNLLDCDRMDLKLAENDVRQIRSLNSTANKSKIKEEIADKIANDGRFSISVDEYTSSKNRRYMCVNLHDENSKVICLGMVRVEGACPAEKAVKLTKTKLAEFGLTVENHILGVVSDGASMMKKYARLLGVEHQICHSHGLHLAVCDLLYKSIPQENSEADGREQR